MLEREIRVVQAPSGPVHGFGNQYVPVDARGDRLTHRLVELVVQRVLGSRHVEHGYSPSSVVRVVRVGQEDLVAVRRGGNGVVALESHHWSRAQRREMPEVQDAKALGG